MLFRLSKISPLVTLDVQPDRLVLGQCGPRHDGLQRLTLEQHRFPPTSVEAAGSDWFDIACEQIEALGREGRFRRTRVAIGLPSSLVGLRHLRLAPLPEEELPEAVRWQTARELNQSIESLETDFIDIGITERQGRRVREVVAASAMRSHLQRLTDLIASAGGSVQRIEPSLHAIDRAIEQVYPIADLDAVMLLIVGERDSQLYLRDQQRPYLIRQLAMGFAPHGQLNAPEADWSMLEDCLVDELSREVQLATYTVGDRWPDMPAVSRGVLICEYGGPLALATRLSQRCGLAIVNAEIPGRCGELVIGREASAVRSTAGLAAIGLALEEGDYQARTAA